MKEIPTYYLKLPGGPALCRDEVVAVKNTTNLRSVLKAGYKSHCVTWERVIAFEQDGQFEILSDPQSLARIIMDERAATYECSVLVNPTPGDIRFYKAVLPFVPGRSFLLTPGKMIRKLQSLDEHLDRLVNSHQAVVGKEVKPSKALHAIFGQGFISLRTITNGTRLFVKGQEKTKPETVVVKSKAPKLTVISGKQPPKRQTDKPAQEKNPERKVRHRKEVQTKFDFGK